MRALLLAALLVLPTVAAEHVFSHRVYVVGRVVDAEGKPAPALPVNVTFEGVAIGGACIDAKPAETSPTGDFEVCRHAHAIPEGARALVRVGGAERAVPVDPDIRHAVASLELAGPAPLTDIQGERTFARSFLVTGRLFALLPAPLTEESVQVNATPLALNATVELRAGAATLARANATPDEHGAYRAQLAVEEIPAGATVRVSVGRDVAEELASPLYRRADVHVLRDERLARGPGSEAPGSSTPLGAAWALVALAAAMLVAQRKR